LGKDTEFVHGKKKSDKDLGATHICCIPVNYGPHKIGALALSKAYSATSHPENELSFLNSVAYIVAQTILIYRGGFTKTSLDAPSLTSYDSEKQFRPKNIIGNSRAIRDVFDQIAQVLKSDTTVLILGESGVGKELVANAIHENSVRKDNPFVKINCAALPATLLESELFGHEKGAFTGAIAQKKGRFEMANGGTLMLDEIGDTSLATQVKLLRVLQERKFERVGGIDTISTNVRLIAATNRNLEEMIEKGEFRRDLYYRLNVYPIHVPPLRSRQTDIIPLADYFVEKYARTQKKDIKRITTPAIDLLISYHWPGNVRELENCIERAVLLSEDNIIHSYHLPPSLQMADPGRQKSKGSLQSILESMEKELIIDALKTCRGNMTKASRDLGLTERIMGLRMKKYKINFRHFRSGTR
jgi:Nif-specific regulatory protein